ncbi:MAG TPA: transglutaminase family protein [Tepidisphaeraceae bacterium]|nr:transglutaminase family protein [Tepidisphaeraceae bacterium]
MPPPTLTLRCGLEFSYHSPAPTPATFLITPRLDPDQHLLHQNLLITPTLPHTHAKDSHGNSILRLTIPANQVTILHHDSFLTLPATPEHLSRVDGPHLVQDLPLDILRYTLPSRYCDSDRLSQFALSTFGSLSPGLSTVQSIVDWTHSNIQYRWGTGSPHTAASEIISQRSGVCRDFAHVAIALCRCFNIPSRYVTGYVPDIAFQDPGDPMDFHAYFQVYLAHRWQTFDARFNASRIGRVHIGVGLDAVDGAFANLFGPASMTQFNVWAYQIDPSITTPHSPIDLSQRLCGTPELKLPK